MWFKTLEFTNADIGKMKNNASNVDLKEKIKREDYYCARWMCCLLTKIVFFSEGLFSVNSGGVTNCFTEELKTGASLPSSPINK